MRFLDKTAAGGKHVYEVVAINSVGLLSAPSAGAAVKGPPGGAEPIFNGTDLTGWHGRGSLSPAALAKMPEAERKGTISRWAEEAKKHWRARGGELIADGKGPALATDRDFGDVELSLECKVGPKGQGVIFLRGGPLLPVGPAAEWQRLKIVQIGERTTVHLGGKVMLDHSRVEVPWGSKAPLPRTGPIQLRADGGEVHWRNIIARPIGSEEANAILRSHNAKGFEPVFNGKDFTGWAGPVDNYEVKEGAIVCRPRKGGNIYTKEVFTDFVARVEYRLPPAGNNGLAIRYPGKGQASAVAMCEVQVLDDTSPRYAKLDPRQYNGSAYGMVPAQRGYLRPVGEWNFMEVTVRGHTIRVELNGTRILDTDLSKVTKFMHGHPHPGKDRLSGHFGFCGHSDPVAFRNIRIKRLAVAEGRP
jgi:hypothetical protein